MSNIYYTGIFFITFTFFLFFYFLLVLLKMLNNKTSALSHNYVEVKITFDM